MRCMTARVFFFSLRCTGLFMKDILSFYLYSSDWMPKSACFIEKAFQKTGCALNPDLF